MQPQHFARKAEQACYLGPAPTDPLEKAPQAAQIAPTSGQETPDGPLNTPDRPAQREFANSRKNSKKMFNTSKKIPAASGIASSCPARRRRLKSTIV